jgi:hypothetical protein
MYKPSPRECAALFLLLVAEREGRTERSVSRVRLSELTLKRLCNRHGIGNQFKAEFREWMMEAGWVLVETGSTFAAVKSDTAADWPRLSAKRIRSRLDEVAEGKFDFSALDHLWPVTDLWGRGAAEESSSADD